MLDLVSPPLALASWLLVVAPPDDAAAYDDAIAKLDAANGAVNRDPEANFEALAQALDQMSRYAPQLADDPRGSEIRVLALLNLARAMLVAGHDAGAGLIMDEAIRLVRGGELPVEQFGPTLARFHTDRREALAKLGQGRLEIRCTSPCEVFVDEQRLELDAERRSDALPFGSYRVWIQAGDGEPLPERHLVEIDVDGEIETLAYPLVAPRVDAQPEPPQRHDRIMPRWAELGLLGVGVGLVAGGAALLAFDGRCPGGRDPVADAAACPKIYESTVGGLTTLGLGAALALSGGITLGIDEVRIGRERSTRAMLGYAFRF
jgi:hypothetical protein